MPRMAPRAVREAALGRYTDESYHNQALIDARAAWDAERVALEQRVEELEREVGKQQKLRKNARKAATNLAEKLAALEDTTPPWAS